MPASPFEPPDLTCDFWYRSVDCHPYSSYEARPPRSRGACWGIIRPVAESVCRLYAVFPACFPAASDAAFDRSTEYSVFQTWACRQAASAGGRGAQQSGFQQATCRSVPRPATPCRRRYCLSARPLRPVRSPMIRSLPHRPVARPDAAALRLSGATSTHAGIQLLIRVFQ